MNFNRIVLIGTVQGNPETKYTTESGVSISKFVLAAARPPRQDGRVEYDHIPVVAFGKAADYSAENLRANSTVLVEGRIQVNQRENNGQRFSQTEINAGVVRVFGAGQGAAPAAVPAPPPAQAAQPETAANPFSGSTLDDVPF